MHFYSGHNDRIKRGIVLGFFLRAYRICSVEYIDEEIDHIISSFTKLKYPKGLLLNLKTKALNIRKKSSKPKKKNKDERYLTIPNSKPAETIASQLEQTGFKVAVTSGKKVGDMFKQKTADKVSDKSVVYQIPCESCNKTYIGETGRGMDIRLKEQTRS